MFRRLQQAVAREIETQGGRHDELAIYGGEPGDLGLAGGPSGMSWELHGDLATILTAGGGAILMEVLHPSVMAGVFTQSSYRTETFRRARATLGYILRTTFGSTPAATKVIESVKRIHGRIQGVRPDGIAYRALDPELIAWVHASIPLAIMTAYDRYVRTLDEEEKNTYLEEQAVIGRMAGADWVPETTRELEAYVERMRPKLQFNEQTSAFLGFLDGSTDPNANRAERIDRWVALRSSMDLMPEWAARLTNTHAPENLQRLCFRPAARLKQRLVRWAYPELPCKRIALARAMPAAGTRASSEVASSTFSRARQIASPGLR
jgi:uncharacterized protein (DUF2236 family)